MSDAVYVFIFMLLWSVVYLINSCRMDSLAKRIEELEKKTVRGKWEKIIVKHDYSEFKGYKCSICGAKNLWMSEICPNCHSEMIMDEVKEDNNDKSN